jgi:hypothetical protein
MNLHCNDFLYNMCVWVSLAVFCTDLERGIHFGH